MKHVTHNNEQLSNNRCLCRIHATYRVPTSPMLNLLFETRMALWRKETKRNQINLNAHYFGKHKWPSLLTIMKSRVKSDAQYPKDIPMNFAVPLTAFHRFPVAECIMKESTVIAMAKNISISIKTMYLEWHDVASNFPITYNIHHT